MKGTQQEKIKEALTKSPLIRGELAKKTGEGVGLIPTITALLISLVEKLRDLINFSIVNIAEAEKHAESLSGKEAEEVVAAITAAREDLQQMEAEAARVEAEANDKEKQIPPLTTQLEVFGRTLAKFRLPIEDRIATINLKAQEYYEVGKKHRKEAGELRTQIEELENEIVAAEERAEVLSGEAATAAATAIASAREDLGQMEAEAVELERLADEASIHERALRAEVNQVRHEELNPIQAEEAAIAQLWNELITARREWEKLRKGKLRLVRYREYWNDIPDEWACDRCAAGVKHPFSNMFHLRIERMASVLRGGDPVLKAIQHLEHEDNKGLLRCRSHRPPMTGEVRSYHLSDTILTAPEILEGIEERIAEKERERRGEQAKPSHRRIPANRTEREEAVAGAEGIKENFLTLRSGISQAADNPRLRREYLLREARKLNLQLVPANETSAPPKAEVVDVSEHPATRAAAAAQLRVQSAIRRSAQVALETEAALNRIQADKAEARTKIERLVAKEAETKVEADKARARIERGKAELQLALLAEEEGRVTARLATARRLEAEAESTARRLEAERLEKKVKEIKQKADALQAEAEYQQRGADEKEDEPATEPRRWKRSKPDALAAKAEAEAEKSKADAVISAAQTAKHNLELAKVEAANQERRYLVAVAEKEVVEAEVALAKLLIELGQKKQETALETDAQGTVDVVEFEEGGRLEQKGAELVKKAEQAVKDKAAALKKLEKERKSVVPISS